MIGHPGPYMNESGDRWVPRTVPYLEARRLAKAEGIDSWDKLVYVGKADATLFGFTRECECDWTCERAEAAAEGDPTADWDECLVPAWHFRVEER